MAKDMNKYIGSKLLKQVKNCPLDWGTIANVGLGIGTVLVGYPVAGAIDSAYAGSHIQDIAVFDLEVDCQNCSSQERLNKGAEAADKLARYLRDNLDADGVRIYRIPGKRSPQELSKNFNTDNYLVCVLTEDAGIARMSANLVDLYPINIPEGDKSYNITSNKKDFDSAIRSLADRITLDVGGEVKNKNFTVGPVHDKETARVLKEEAGKLFLH